MLGSHRHAGAVDVGPFKLAAECFLPVFLIFHIPVFLFVDQPNLDHIPCLKVPRLCRVKFTRVVLSVVRLLKC